MSKLSPWDQIDTSLLTALNRSSATLPELIDASGCTGDVVKALVDGYQQAGLVTRTVDAGVRYQITLAGRRHLAGLLRTTTSPATRVHQAAA